MATETSTTAFYDLENIPTKPFSLHPYKKCDFKQDRHCDLIITKKENTVLEKLHVNRNPQGHRAKDLQCQELFSNDNNTAWGGFWKLGLLGNCKETSLLKVDSADNLQFYLAIRIFDTIFKSLFIAISSKNRTD